MLWFFREIDFMKIFREIDFIKKFREIDFMKKVCEIHFTKKITLFSLILVQRTMQSQSPIC